MRLPCRNNCRIWVASNFPRDIPSFPRIGRWQSTHPW
jgi:hypothetical protein